MKRWNGDCTVAKKSEPTASEETVFVPTQYLDWFLLAEKAEGSIPVLPRGYRQFPFHFLLPESCLPCSFESKIGTIRYYIKVHLCWVCANLVLTGSRPHHWRTQATVDIPYASPPQGMKYFTIIGPHIDCMEELYLVSVGNRSLTSWAGGEEIKNEDRCMCCTMLRSDVVFLSFWTLQKPLSRCRKRTSCCLCCRKGPLSLSVQLDRSAYACGESLRLKADINNRSQEDVRLRLRLIQVRRTIR